MAAPKTFSKANFAYEVLRRKILDKAYQPGDRLRLAQLARELSLSEMPIREALRLLEKEGLVVIHLHRGAEVARLSLQRGREVMEARLVLERRAAVTAMPHHDAGSIARLHGRLAEMELAQAAIAQFTVKHRAFFTALYAVAPNALMAQLIEDLWDQMWQASSSAVFEMMRHRVAETIEESRMIVAHVAAREAGELDAVMTMRLQRTLVAWGAALKSVEAPVTGPAGVDAPGLEAPIAKVPRAKVQGAKVQGAKVPGAKVPRPEQSPRRPTRNVP